ncbi:MAG: hypothetical protein ACI9TV_000074 [Sulfurimonas sp.]|jgi:hypothetical protein|uniref:hypothetical protein n=1 Tax=Sulfurimonas sp. TaxID=2022749 RepID=UPI0039E5DACD
MRTFALIFIFAMNIEAFNLDFIKPNTLTTNIQKKSSQTSKIKFVPISHKYETPIIKQPYAEDNVFSDIKLGEDAQYDPYAESKKVANDIENKKNRISSIDAENNIEHIIYRSSKKSLSKKKFIYLLTLFHQ